LIEEDMNEGSKLLGPPYVYLYVCACCISQSFPLSGDDDLTKN
jgi:hypothetical protein